MVVIPRNAPERVNGNYLVPDWQPSLQLHKRLAYFLELNLRHCLFLNAIVQIWMPAHCKLTVLLLDRI